MNPLAIELNKTLETCVVHNLLSDMGQRFYFPKGIVSQAAEAAQHAHLYDVTVGIAKDHNKPMNLSVIRNMLPDLTEDEIFSYAPTSGVMALRKKWKEELVKKNPGLKGKSISMPLVTSGITNGISLIADLFANKGDEILVPDMYWGNYNIIFEGRREAKVVTFPFYKDNLFDTEGFRKALTQQGEKSDKIIVLLNFPNNPTGYTPMESEIPGIVSALNEQAEAGKKLLVLLDDAYFSLFYEDHTYKYSLFMDLVDLHPNILAVKLDGATKEDFVWGFRIGFITYGGKGLSEPQIEALTKKTMGIIRASISNSNMLGQNLLLHAMSSPGYEDEKKQAMVILKQKYVKMTKILKEKTHPRMKPLHFNSGYFMCFVLDGIDAEEMRKYLLHEMGIGAISIKKEYLRITYSSVDLEKLDNLVDLLHQAADKLSS